LTVTSSGSGGNLNIPRVPFVDPISGMPALPWMLWLQNPSVNAISSANGIGISSGGTGITTTPQNGQILIGAGSGYALGRITGSTGLSVTNGSGTISLTNTGVTSLVAGSGISISSATGAVTLSNSGVLSFSAGSTGLTPSTATTGAVSLAGTLNVAHGGSGANTLTGYLYGNGTSAFTASTTIPSTAITGSTSGLSVTITTAKITPVTGTNGSMTFTNGILTAQTQAT